MSKSQAERREEAETKLLDAATHLIATKGFDGFKLAEVGAAAGYSRGLPVHYFGSKDQLLVRVASHILHAYSAAFARHRETERGLPRLLQMIRLYCSLPVTDNVRALAILAAHARVLPPLRDAMHRLNGEGLRSLEHELERGIEQGNVRPGIDCRRVAQMIFSFLRGQLLFMAVDPAFDAKPVGETFIATLVPTVDVQAAPARKPARATRRSA